MARGTARQRVETLTRSNPNPGIEALVRPIVGGLLILVPLLGLIGTAIKNPQPHDIQVGLAGPAPATEQISRAFATSAPGAFRFTTYSSEGAARAAIDARSVDGALVLTPSGPRLIVAGAAGDAVTGVIRAAFGNAVAAQGQTLTVEIVHPFSSGDPHGLILFFVILAVLISTLVAQALLGLTPGIGFGLRLSLLVVFAVLAALLSMAIATWIAGDYGSGFWVATAVLALASAAVGAVVAASARLLGVPGVGLAALVVVLLDLVSSGGPLGSNLLPDFYRWLAPGMPVAQVYSAIRGALFFDNAGIGSSIAVLSAWLVGGLILMAAAELIRPRQQPKAAALAADPS
jgi:hypothetical protein